MTPYASLMERLWARVLLADGDGCWEWQGATTAGYGAISVEAGRVSGTHRVSWELAYGPIPDGLLVCHTCDNPRCVRPSHLFLGTHADNSRDMAEKGRAIAPNKGHATCKHGHPYTPENTYLHPKKGSRMCRICRKAASARMNERERRARREVPLGTL